MTHMDRDTYIVTVKETLKFILIPAFVQQEQKKEQG
jgi:hypothetical protein